MIKRCHACLEIVVCKAVRISVGTHQAGYREGGFYKGVWECPKCGEEMDDISEKSMKRIA